MNANSISRRDLLQAASLLVIPSVAPLAVSAATRSPLKLSVFSKHLQFVKDEELATCASEIGVDGVDLTVRPGGHIEPANIAKDLPRLVEILHRKGLETPMVTTSIDAATPEAESILKTCAQLGIRYYRFGGLKYNDATPPQQQLAALKPRMRALAELNQKHGVCGIYHTHSGAGQLGASIWDLHILFEGLPTSAIGINYDIGHATIEGGLGGWMATTKLAGAGGMRGLAVKDFVWAKGAKGWDAKWVPLGEGMVKFPQFFAMLGKTDFHGPVQIHYEYPLGGADKGATQLTMDRANILGAMKNDVVKLRRWMAEAKLL